MKIYILLVLFCLYGPDVLSQNLYLKIKSDDVLENNFIDSLSYSKSHLNVKSLLEEKNKFLNTISKQGFFQAVVINNEKTNDSTFSYFIKLGKQNKFIHIYIGKNSNQNETDFSLLKNDSIRVKSIEIEGFMNQILQKLEQKGYALAKIKLDNFFYKKNELYAELNINAEKIRKLDDIVIKGYDNFPENFKKNSIRIYKKMVFNQDLLQKIQQDFNKLSFINQTKYPEILFSKDSTKVFVYLEKAKPNRFDGFLGFNNDNAQKVSINGYLDLQLQNIINGGEKINIFWKSDGKNQKNFNVNTEIPYVFKSPMGLKAQLNIFKQDSIFQNTKTSVDLGYYFSFNKKLFIGYQETESNDIQNKNTSFLSDFQNSFLTSEFDYSKRDLDNLLFPEKTNFNIKTGFGNRISSNNSNSQFFLNLNLNHNFGLDKKNSIYLKSINNYLQSNQYVVNELYRFGGINSIRGFIENSLQANIFTSILSEYRYIASQNLYLHTILDYGYYKDNSSKTSNNLLGIGFGFGLLTKNGLLNFVYANGSTKDQTIKLSNSIVHVSVKTSF